MKNLQLSLKKQWFEMTKSDEKKEDYREITPYWCKRLINRPYNNGSYNVSQMKYFEKYYPSDFIKKFTTNTMTLGYPKSTNKERILIFEHAGIEIGYGKPEWGAEPNKLYFIIKHGKRLQ